MRLRLIRTLVFTVTIGISLSLFAYDDVEALQEAAHDCLVNVQRDLHTQGYKYLARKRSDEGSFKIDKTKSIYIGLNKLDPKLLKIGVFFDNESDPSELYELDLTQPNKEANKSILKIRDRKSFKTCSMASPSQDCAKIISERRLKWAAINAKLVQEPDENMKAFDCLLGTVKEADKIANPESSGQVSDS